MFCNVHSNSTQLTTSRNKHIYKNIFERLKLFGCTFFSECCGCLCIFSKDNKIMTQSASFASTSVARNMIFITLKKVFANVNE